MTVENTTQSHKYLVELEKCYWATHLSRNQW